jgi:predicted small lipoprotein YifL
MNPTRAIVALALLTLALAACGQKGPLYLPDSTQGEVITRPTQTPAEAPAETPAAPAPEATAPEGTAPEATDPDKDKKKDGATPPK